jgi:hypothetical protein
MQRIGPLAGCVVHLIPKRPEPDSRRELSVTGRYYTASIGKLEMCVCAATARHSWILDYPHRCPTPSKAPIHRPLPSGAIGV